MTIAETGGAKRLGWVSPAVTLLVIAATLVAATEAFGPIHGFKPWMMIGFICVVELLFGIAATAFLSSSTNGSGPSSATLAILAGIVIGYALTLGVALFAISMFTAASSTSGDHLMVAVVVILSAVWLSAAAAMYTHDLRMAVVAAPILQARARHVRCAKDIRIALQSMTATNALDDDAQRTLDLLGKRLETAATALSHSHSGYGGEHASRSNTTEKEQWNAVVESGTQELGCLVEKLHDGSADELRDTLSALSRCTGNLTTAVTELELE